MTTPSQPAAPRWDARYHHTSAFGAGERQALSPAHRWLSSDGDRACEVSRSVSKPGGTTYGRDGLQNQKTNEGLTD